MTHREPPSKRLLRRYEVLDSKGKVKSGCSTGWVLSPLLCDLVLAELLEERGRQGCKVVGYADDLKIIVRGPFLDTPMEIIQRSGVTGAVSS